MAAKEHEMAKKETATALMEAFDDLLKFLPVSELRLQVYNARKLFYQKAKLPGHSLLQLLETRSEEPAVARFLKVFNTWNNLLETDRNIDGAYQPLLLSTYQQIVHATGQEPFQRSMLFASHDLLSACKKIDPACGSLSKKERQFLLSAYQYLTRGALKTSPFSRLTTVQMLDLQRDAPELNWLKDRAVVTPNVALLPAFYAFFLQHPAFYRSLSLRLNPSVRLLDNGSYEWLHFDGEQESFQAMPVQPAVAILMELLQNIREKPFMELLLDLQERVDAPAEKLENFLLELTDYGLLAWKLPEPGTSAAWVSNLIQYLAHLPGADVFSEWIFLLQHLRSTARTLSYKPVSEALTDLTECKQLLDQLFAKHQQPIPQVPAARLFFEDVETGTVDFPAARQHINKWAAELHDCLQANPNVTFAGLRARIFQAASELLATGESMNFLDFCRACLQSPAAPESRTGVIDCPVVGALVMPFTENGKQRAVVNALYPGGGKLFARWLHLFPDTFRTALEQWQSTDMIPFPWQSWSNANFQPHTKNQTLEVPDGRFGKGLLLSQLQVKQTAGGPVLSDESGARIVLSDLGLEAPEWRPPVMQLLWHLGVPYISTAVFPAGSKERLSDGVYFTQRVEYQSLVLKRATWIIEPEPRKTWLLAWSNADFFATVRTRFQHLKIPRFVFVKPLANREKPQFVDMDSPVSVLLLEKTMRLHPERVLQIEEMLPLPEQWAGGASQKIPVEIAFEFRIDILRAASL